MNKLVLLACGAASTFVLATIPDAVAAQQEEGSQRTYVRSFRLHRADARVAETWVWERCTALRGEAACRVVEVVAGDEPRIAIEGTDRVHAEVARLLAQRDAAVRPARSFQLVLLEATKDRRGAIDPALGEEARAVLGKVADYLPYAGFRVLDTAFVTTTRHGRTRLLGAQGLPLSVELTFRDTHSAEGETIDVLQLRVRGEVVRELDLSPPAAGTGTGEPPQRARSLESLLDTSLSMRPGETVVAGTSRLGDGDGALVVLLTAVES